MSIVTYTYARRNLASLMEEVERDRAPIFISRQRKRGAAVLVSQDDWNSTQETLHLLRSPKNAKRLRKAIDDLDAGKPTESGLPRR